MKKTIPILMQFLSALLGVAVVLAVVACGAVFALSRVMTLQEIANLIYHNQLLFLTVCLFVLASVFVLVFVLLVGITVARIVLPLKHLTQAVHKLAENEYEVELPPCKTREIDGLNEAISHLADTLREREILAYRDSLTGLHNANAYRIWAHDFDEQIKAGTDGVFGLMVLDINDLKEVNDRYGHEVGNQIIVKTAEMLRDVFGRSPVFRIGGDEFLVILRDRDFLRFAPLIERFAAESTALAAEVNGRKIPITVAYGTAIFDPEQDRGFSEVFQRADEIMYEQKRKMKA